MKKRAENDVLTLDTFGFGAQLQGASQAPAPTSTGGPIRFLFVALFLMCCGGIVNAQTGPVGAPRTYYDAIKADYEALRGDIYAKQGYPREQSAAMLDPAVRQLLDAALRLYREPGLFTNRAKALELLGVTQTRRRWSDTPPVEGGHRAFVDTFAREGLFARPAWTGEYRYNGKREGRLDGWHAFILIKVDPGQECHNSRAVEGYLDLVLDPGIKGFAHPVTERLRRHEVPFARPSAKELTPVTPSLSLTFTDGCLAELGLVNIFSFKDISDDHAHD